MDKVMVYLNKKDLTRHLVEAELIHVNDKTILVRLPDDRVVVRHKKKHLPTKEEPAIF